MHRTSPYHCWPLAAIVAIATLSTLPASAPAAPPARAARVLQIQQSSSLHLVRRSGSTLDLSGTATGTLPGRVSARLTVTVVRVTGTVTFRPRSGGSLTFTVEGYPESAAIRARFRGVMRVTGGTGRFAGAEGAASASGLVNRRTWDANVTATGAIRY